MISEIIYKIQNFLSLHSLQCSLDDRDYKDGICLAIFGLMGQLLKCDQDEFEKHIFETENGLLYCWSIEKLETLKNKHNVFLCCSKPDGFYNTNAVRGKTYKYQYKIKLKENRFGIDLNSFFEGTYKISDKDIKKNLYFNSASYHPCEKEVIVRLSDIEFERIT